MHYDLVTAPRDFDINQLQIAYNLHQSAPNKVNLFSLQSVIALGKDRFVCPVPGCGKSFHSTDSCFRHMKVHEHKQRLAAATPLADAHLQYYWPKDIPWSVSAGEYAQPSLPPGSIRCSYRNCQEVFSTVYKMYNHLRLVHAHVHPSHSSLDYYTLGEVYLSVPPEKMPFANCQLVFCKSHMLPSKSCARCMEVEQMTKGAPKPPYRMLHSVSINLHRKRDRLHMLADGNGGNKNKEKYTGSEEAHRIQECDRFAYLLMQDEQGQSYKARCQYIVFDRNNLLWLGIEKLYSLQDIASKKVPLLSIPLNEISSADELIPTHAAQCRADCWPEDIRYVPVHTVQAVEAMAVLTIAQCRHWQRSKQDGIEAKCFIRQDRLY